MADLQTLLWLRARQLGRASRYWLMSIGYDPGAGAVLDQITGLYVLAAVLAILVVGWAGAINAAWQTARGLAGGSGPHALATLVPFFVLAVQAVVVAAALSSSPLKLPFADMAHIAGAPLRRSAVVGVAFLRGLPLRILVLAAIGDLGSILLAGSLHEQGAGAATAASVGVFTAGLGWCVGLLRMRGARRRSRWLWPLALIVAGLLAWGVPGVALWPGRMLQAALTRPGPVWHPLLLWLLLAVVALLVVLGDDVHLTRVSEESGLYARLQALGPLARMDPTAMRQVRLERVQAGRRARMALPALEGPALLAGRTFIAYVRLPSRALWLVRDIGLTVLGCWVILGHGVVPWGDWVVAAIVVPPRGTGDTFAADSREPFLRQLLPVSDFELLAADAGLPLLVVLALSVVAWIIRRPAGSSIVAGVLGAAILLAVRTLAQGVASTRSGGRWRPPFIAVAGLCFGLIGVFAVPGHNPAGALLLGAGMAVLMAMVAAQS